jgi:23S rRNA (guanine2535-N1)-methyltransferase
MKYLFETERRDYSTFASGAVLYSLPGTSAFPVRLISELFQYCYSHLQQNDIGKTRVTIFDPCCGSAYHLAALGFLHPDKIAKIICSDIDEDILAVARKNLSLLSTKGMDERITELDLMHAKYKKESHQQALAGARELKKSIKNAIVTACQQDDILGNTAFENLKNESIDVVFADVPYGNMADWQGNITDKDEVWALLENLQKIAKTKTMTVIASNKKQRVVHDKYSRIRQIKAGTRKITILGCAK